MSDVELKYYLERLIAESDRRYEQRFAASEQAVLKAERAMAARLDSMNEFREALKDQANRMATRDELERIEEAVHLLERAKANLDGRFLVMGGIISAGISLFIALLSRWLS